MKLPVFKAIGMTFAFVISNWLDILKIIWLPTVLLIGASALIMPGYVQAFSGLAQPGAQPSPDDAARMVGSALPLALGLLLLSIAYYLIIFAGVLKLVIRGEKPRLPFYLGFGADEWRLLATWALLVLIFIGFEIVLGLVMLAVGFAAGGAGGAGAIIAGIVTLIAVIGFIWLCLRFSLATPATVGASTIGIGPSWNASKGNVWSLFFYWLIWGVIFLVLYGAVITIMMPDYFAQMGRMISAAGSGSLEEVEAASNAMTQASFSMYDFSSPVGMARLVLGTLLGAVVMAILVVSGGVAWRLMTDDKPEQHFE